MSIFTFEDEQAIGEVVRVDTGRVWVRVNSAEKLRLARVGRLVTIRGGDANEWVVGIVDRIWRKPVEPEAEEEGTADGQSVVTMDCPIEENGASLLLVGTYRAVDGENKNVFTRAVLVLPSIDEKVFPVEEGALESFMGIISRTAEGSAVDPLEIGVFTLDEKAKAFVDGNKLFQRHAALVGSTGSGKSWTVASIVEQIAKLPHADVILFDLHGEYKSLGYARQLRVAGPGDIGKEDAHTLYLPYWLLTYEEMQAMFIDVKEHTAHNQAMAFHDAVETAKREALTALGKEELLECFTIDTPVPFSLDDVLQRIKERNEEMVEGARGPKQGEFFGQFSRFLIRMETKVRDRRYAFMYQPPETWMRYETLHELAESLLGHGGATEDANGGVKVIDFSEVPSEILPTMVSLVGRLVFQVQLWCDAGEDGTKRHPVLMICDEAHAYMPRGRDEGSPMERRALETFERIAKEGRKYGVGLMVVSQRPADVSPTILSQCNNLISLRLTNAEDQAVAKRLMPETMAGVLELLPTLDVGEAVIVGAAILLPTRVRLNEPAHKPLSCTVNIWSRWADKEATSDLAKAVENLRLQRR